VTAPLARPSPTVSVPAPNRSAPPVHGHLWSLPDGTGLHAPIGSLVAEPGTGRLCCHLCGRWFISLGVHVRFHGQTAGSYRAAMGLAPGRAPDRRRGRRDGPGTAPAGARCAPAASASSARGRPGRTRAIRRRRRCRGARTGPKAGRSYSRSPRPGRAAVRAAYSDASAQGGESGVPVFCPEFRRAVHFSSM
jgi:hypothetical protein